MVVCHWIALSEYYLLRILHDPEKSDLLKKVQMKEMGRFVLARRNRSGLLYGKEMGHKRG